MRGTRKFGWLTAVALAGSLALGTGPAAAATTYIETGGELEDLQPAATNATDGAWADLWVVQSGSRSTYWVLFSGLSGAVGTRYGVHVHVGPCVAGNGAAAGPHYNTGGTPTESNEVWLDFTVRPGGYGFASTTVPFVIEPGAANSIVVHAEPTQDGGATPGAAGARQACLPVQF
jgi:Cu/Zn superoxide dismutase